MSVSPGGAGGAACVARHTRTSASVKSPSAVALVEITSGRFRVLGGGTSAPVTETSERFVLPDDELRS